MQTQVTCHQWKILTKAIVFYNCNTDGSASFKGINIILTSSQELVIS